MQAYLSRRDGLTLCRSPLLPDYPIRDTVQQSKEPKKDPRRLTTKYILVFVKWLHTPSQGNTKRSTDSQESKSITTTRTATKTRQEKSARPKEEKREKTAHHGPGSAHRLGDTHRDGGGRGHQLEEAAECPDEGEDQVQHDSDAVHRRGPTDRGLDRTPRGKGKAEYPLSVSLTPLSISCHTYSHTHAILNHPQS